MQERNECQEFELLPAEDLAKLLERFYGEACTKEGRTYSRSSLIGIRAGINRHIQGVPYLQPTNIITDKQFVFANKILLGRAKISLRNRRNEAPKQISAITPEDIKKMYSSGVLSNKNSVSLQNKVFFEIYMHFVRRGRERLHDFKRNSFVFKKDEDSGLEYVTLAANEKYKRNNGTEKDLRMYSIPSDADYCPVRSLKFYLSKLHPENEAFFQPPKVDAPDYLPIWYYKRSLGMNTLAGKMKAISNEGKLSQTYTNHCIQITSKTVLAKSPLNKNDSTTEKSDSENVLPCNRYTSNQLRRDMSRTLYKYACSNNESN